MYSRKLGISENNNSSGNLEKFNEHLREQYDRKRKNINPTMHSPSTTAIQQSDEPQTSVNSLIENAKSGLSNLNFNIDSQTIIILGLIIVLLTDADLPDLILLGILASLIF